MTTAIRGVWLLAFLPAGCDGGAGNDSARPDGAPLDASSTSKHDAGAQDATRANDATRPDARASDARAGTEGAAPETGTAGADGGTVIFVQPALSGSPLPLHFFAPLCTSGIGAGKTADAGVCGVTAWQCPPQDAGFVADPENASTLTGFDPNGGQSLATFQVGYSATAPGSSVVQIDGNQVGVYMDSTDLNGACPSPSDGTRPGVGCKMGMFPQVKFSTGKYMPFKAGGTVVVSFQKEIATASTSTSDAGKSQAYAVSDLLFVDTSGGTHIDPSTHKPYQFSYGETVFNGSSAPLASCGPPKVDQPTGGIIVGCPMVSGHAYSTYFTLLSDAGFQSATWNTMKTFTYSVSASQFQAALIDAARTLTDAGATDAGAPFSMNPEDYSLVEWHANDELNDYERGKSTLGVTTRGVTITLE